MTIGEDREVWFPAPSRDDDSAACRGEPTTDWLKRSTHPRAKAARHFLNENLRFLPPEHLTALHQALHERWHSAFFELIVGRALQILGATIEIEPGGANDIRVDFAARFPDRTVAVEAVSPVFGSEVGETVKRRNPLLDIIESESPPDLWAMWPCTKNRVCTEITKSEQKLREATSNAGRDSQQPLTRPVCGGRRTG